MAVSLSKVRDEAPHLVARVKQTMAVAAQLGLDPRTDKAAVVATIDDSGSAQRLYQSGEVQTVADQAFAAGLVFDDDGTMPVSFFNNRVQDLGEINLGNCKGFIARQRPQWGRTNYVNALKWIIDQAGYSNVDLGSSSGGFFKRSSNLEVKATAKYPTFAMFITDGNPDDPDQTKELLTRMSQLPIFVQFVGIGPAKFTFLEELNSLGGRLVDNAGTFDSKRAHDEQSMLEGLLNEFPSYLKDARRVGLIS